MQADREPAGEVTGQGPEEKDKAGEQADAGRL